MNSRKFPGESPWIVLFLIAFCAFVQGENRIQESGRGNIQGRVTDAQGKGMAGVLVVAYNAETEAHATTDSAGNYFIGDLLSGEYNIQFIPAGPGDISNRWFKGKTSPEEATSVEVRKGETQKGIDLQMKAFGSLRGRVLDDQGRGIPLMEVIAYNPEYAEAGRSFTDGDGNYELASLTEGTYRILVNPPDSSPWIKQWVQGKDSFERADVFKVPASGTATAPEVRMTRGSAIAGRVTGSLGEAVPFVIIEIIGPNQTEIARTTSDSDGRWRIDRLPPGGYRLHFIPERDSPHMTRWYPTGENFQSAQAMLLSSGKEVLGVDQILTTCGGIQGTVTDDDGHALNGIRVEVETLEGHYVSDGTSGFDGGFSIDRIPPGRYKICFTPAETTPLFPQWYPEADSFASAREIQVLPGQILSHIHARLKTAGGISGQVTDENGLPVARVEVDAYDEEERRPAHTVTDSTGGYTLNRLSKGKYTVFFSTYSNQPEYLSQWYNGKNRPDKHDEIAVETGRITRDIHCHLHRGGAISGKVTSTSGAGIADVWVEAYNPDAHSTTSAKTDRTGHYRIVGLIAGHYRVTFNPRDVQEDDYIPSYYKNRMKLNSTGSDFGDTTEPVSVFLGRETTKIDAVMLRHATISGRLSDPEGRGIANVNVFAFSLPSEKTHLTHPTPSVGIRASGLNMGNSPRLLFEQTRKETVRTSTQEDGTYRLKRLPPGKYHIQFFSNANGIYLNTWFSNRYSPEEAGIVTLTEGQDLAAIDLMMKGGGIVSGIVTDVEKRPLANIEVQLFDLNCRQLLCGKTGTRGGFELLGVLPGKYKIRFFDYTASQFLPCWYSHAFSFADADVVEMRKEKEKTEIRQELRRGNAILGSVRDSQGNPVQHYNVEAIDEESRIAARATSDAQGKYRLRPLPNGAYRVHFWKSPLRRFPEGWYPGLPSSTQKKAVDLRNNQTVGDIDFQLPAGCAISGRVAGESAAGVPGVWVRLISQKNETIDSVKTEANGLYHLQGIPPGSYKIFFEANETTDFLSQWYPAKETFAEAGFVTMEAGASIANVDVSLACGGSIAGSVTDEDGLGIHYANVQIFTASGEHSLLSLSTDRSGKYKANRLPSGTYRVHVNPPSQLNLMPQWYGASSPQQTVTVTKGKVTAEIDLRLCSGGEISGRITDPNKRGVSDFIVCVYSEGGDKIAQTESAMDGRYRVFRLPSGRYQVLFHSNYRDNLNSQYYHRRHTRSDADTVIVELGRVTGGIDAQLRTGGAIRGKVTGPKGQGIAEIEVSLVDRENRRVAGTWTDALGNYTMPALESGTYKIFFHSNRLDYFSQWYKEKTSRENATEVAVMEGKAKGDMDACLAMAGKIRGSVIDEEGMPLAGVDVEARSLVSRVSGSGQTDDKGNFVIGGLDSGAYTLYVHPPETSRLLPQWYEKSETKEGARPLDVSSGQESPWIVFRLQRKRP